MIKILVTGGHGRFASELKIKWPGKNFIISVKDKKLNSFEDFKKNINIYK